MIVKDATLGQKVFVRLEAVEPGCFVVYGDKDGRQGHIGVVTTVRSQRDYDVVDCSWTSWHRDGDAIQERKGTVFRHNGAIPVALKQDLA